MCMFNTHVELRKRWPKIYFPQKKCDRQMGQKYPPLLLQVFWILVRTTDICALYNCVYQRCALSKGTNLTSFSNNVNTVVLWSSSGDEPYVCADVAYTEIYSDTIRIGCVISGWCRETVNALENCSGLCTLWHTGSTHAWHLDDRFIHTAVTYAATYYGCGAGILGKRVFRIRRILRRV